MSSTLACAAPCASQRSTAKRINHRNAPRLHVAPLAPQQHQQQRRQGRRVCAVNEEDLDQQLQADLERMRQRQQGAAPSAPSAQQAAAQQHAKGNSNEGSGPLAGLKDAVDKVLMADFFFILFALGWLGAALAESSVLHSTNLLDSWLLLWQWVFQPAIGVLMLGALVSGAVGWAKGNTGLQR